MAEDISIGSVLSAVAASLNTKSYALLRFFESPRSASVISASCLDFDVSDLPNEVLSAETTTVDLREPRSDFGVGEFYSLVSIKIDDITRLVFFNDSPVTISTPMLSTVISHLLNHFPLDVDFLLKKVSRFSDSEFANLASRGFSIDLLNDDEVITQMIAMFSCRGLLDELQVDKAEFVRFIVAIRALYNQVPYHNWRHAADSTQFVFSVVMNANVRKYLSSREVFGVLLASVCHDTDHDGRNNNFQRKAQTVLAQLAPNLPPLELHHADVAMNVLNLRHPGVLANWTEQEICAFEKFVVSCILATDMEKHKMFVEQFTKVRTEFDKDSAEHRTLLGQIIMKAADLSNTVRDFNEAAAMTDRLMTESFMQGDREEELGLEISPMCDRKNAAPVPVGQIGFYKFVAGPLMSELHAFFPELDENEKQYHSNLAKWTEMKETVSK